MMAHKISGGKRQDTKRHNQCHSPLRGKTEEDVQDNSNFEAE